MKKIIYIISSLFIMTSQAQDRPQPKPGPAPTININKPQSFTLKNGLKVLVVENHKLPRVSFTLTLDNAPYAEGNKKGVSDMLSSMIGNGTTKTPKDKFNEEIDILGANINFWDSGASASGLSKYSNRMLELMSEGVLMPLFSQEEFDKEKSKMIEGLKTQEKNVQANARRVENVLVYGKNHPSGEFTSEATLNNISLNDVVTNYNSYFVPEKGYLVVIGDVKFKTIKKQIEKAFGKWKKEVAPKSTFSNPTDVAQTQINFVDMPNAVQSEVAVLNISNLKKTNKDYFAALLANQILGGGGEGRLFLNLREKHGWTYGAYSSLGSSKYVSKFRAGASVRNAVTDSSIVEILNEIKRIRTELVSEEDLKNAKAKYVGNFVMQIEKPSTIADYALNKETEGLPEDFYENYIKNINAVTAEDIRNAAQKYFSEDNTRILVVGKAADVLAGLEKLKLPLYYFDKEGNPTEKPVVKKELPKGVTTQTVLNNYINAIGGEKILNTVKSIAITSNGNIQGQSIDMITKKTTNNQMSTVISAMGMELGGMKIGKNGGFQIQQGQKKALEKEKFEEAKTIAVPFVELNLLKNKTATLSGIDNVEGKDAYVIKDGKNSYYYDVNTGLKIAEGREMEQAGQKINQITNFDDYKEVKGIKFPHKTILNMGMALEFTANSIKINEGVTDADFE